MEPRYLVWGLVVVIGAGLGYLDCFKLRRPWLGLAILATVVGGYETTVVSPFTFAGDDYYMQGVLICAAGLLAAAGYLGLAALFALRLGWRRLRKPRSS